MCHDETLCCCYFRNFYARILLAVSDRAARVLASLILIGNHFRPFLHAHILPMHNALGNMRQAHMGLLPIKEEKNFVEFHFSRITDQLDVDNIALFHSVLLSTCLNDRVHKSSLMNGGNNSPCQLSLSIRSWGFATEPTKGLASFGILFCLFLKKIGFQRTPVLWWGFGAKPQ